MYVLGCSLISTANYKSLAPYLTRKAPRVGANSSSVFAFDMHYK